MYFIQQSVDKLDGIDSKLALVITLDKRNLTSLRLSQVK